MLWKRLPVERRRGQRQKTFSRRQPALQAKQPYAQVSELSLPLDTDGTLTFLCFRVVSCQSLLRLRVQATCMYSLQYASAGQQLM